MCEKAVPTRSRPTTSLSISYPYPSLLYWHTVSLVRWTQYSYIYKHSKALELTEKHDKHVLQLTANCN